MPSSSYTLLDIPTPQQRLIHVHPGAEELGRIYQPDSRSRPTPAAFAAAARDAAAAERASPGRARPRRRTPITSPGPTSRAELPGTFQYRRRSCAWLRDRLPKDAIICNGAGNYAGWMHRYHRFHSYATQLAPTSGSMGYGVPAAVLAKRQYPDRIVVAFAGDGCFLMNGQEFATAVQYDAPLIVIVVDNAQYGTIRMHQERDYPGRVVGTELKNPDFRDVCEGVRWPWRAGRAHRRVRTGFERALASGKPSILHCIIDPRAISVGKDFAPAVKA